MRPRLRAPLTLDTPAPRPPRRGPANNVRFSREGGATPETFFPKLVQEIPSNRIAWGSNCPASAGTLPQMVAEAKAALACLSQSDQDWIFAKTAQKLYPALAD